MLFNQRYFSHFAGMKYLSENLMWHISSQVGELKKIVQQNRETLTEIRESFDKPEVMKELIRFVPHRMPKRSSIVTLLPFISNPFRIPNRSLKDSRPLISSFTKRLESGFILVQSNLNDRCCTHLVNFI